MKMRAELKGQDCLDVEYEISPDESKKLLCKKVSYVGCTAFGEMMQGMRRHFGVDVSTWPLPEGVDHSSILLREMILKLRGQWKLPYEELNVCRCRSVATEIVDQAVVAGAHSPEAVIKSTSASSSCGSCRQDVQKIIDYRLNKKSA